MICVAHRALRGRLGAIWHNRVAAVIEADFQIMRLELGALGADHLIEPLTPGHSLGRVGEKDPERLAADPNRRHPDQPDAGADAEMVLEGQHRPVAISRQPRPSLASTRVEYRRHNERDPWRLSG